MDVTPYAPTNQSEVAMPTQSKRQSASSTMTARAETATASTSITPSPPFQFLAGNQNPIASAVGKDVMVSDSLVTIPVIDYPRRVIHSDKPTPSP